MSEGDHTGAFKVQYEAFRILKSGKVDQSHAEYLLISAIKSPQVINLEEIMLLANVQELKKNS
jgi:hypothetical protein